MSLSKFYKFIVILDFVLNFKNGSDIYYVLLLWCLYIFRYMIDKMDKYDILIILEDSNVYENYSLKRGFYR